LWERRDKRGGRKREGCKKKKGGSRGIGINKGVEKDEKGR
jgi:hypothetical protein